MLRQGKHPYSIVALFAALILISGSILAGEIRIPTPPLPPLPKIVFKAPPAMIWLPGPQVYVAHDSPYPIFHHAGHYYLNHEGSWYIGPGYDGPWTTAHHNQVPPGLRSYRGEHWEKYQHESSQRFREGRDHDHVPFYAGRGNGHARERAHWKDNDHDRGRHNGKESNERHGKGRGRDD
jgi:hypothetical protein